MANISNQEQNGQFLSRPWRGRFDGKRSYKQSHLPQQWIASCWASTLFGGREFDSGNTELNVRHGCLKFSTLLTTLKGQQRYQVSPRRSISAETSKIALSPSYARERTVSLPTKVDLGPRDRKGQRFPRCSNNTRTAGTFDCDEIDPFVELCPIID